MYNNDDNDDFYRIPAEMNIDYDFIPLNRSYVFLFCRKLFIHFMIIIDRHLFFRLYMSLS